MEFTFRKPHKIIGWLEFYSMDQKGVKLPLHEGYNFIGKGLENFCEYNERNQLQGIVEQSQVIVKINSEGCAITDFTSTNQTVLIRGQSATIVSQQLQQSYEVFKKSIYFNEGSLPYGVASKDIKKIPWQALDINIKDRVFLPLHNADVLCHFYGFMIVRILQT